MMATLPRLIVCLYLKEKQRYERRPETTLQDRKQTRRAHLGGVAVGT